MLLEVNSSADTSTHARSRGTAQHRRHDSYVMLSQKKERKNASRNQWGGYAMNERILS